tara:strand:- start:230 stop:376 length:147 start_codon:yes stop_codon:yes gene_type:complete
MLLVLLRKTVNIIIIGEVIVIFIGISDIGECVCISGIGIGGFVRGGLN